jgi:predicted mannosyl-3-phosphoglycerate phosphatase (HAD superfamily)
MPNKQPLTIAVDFDGTICEHRWPHIGEPMPKAFEVIKKLKEAGHRLILWTCRSSEGNLGTLQHAIDFCKVNGIEFHAHNENFPASVEEIGFEHIPGSQRKIYADYYIDDRIIGGFPGRDIIEEILLNDKILTYSLS